MDRTPSRDITLNKERDMRRRILSSSIALLFLLSAAITQGQSISIARKPDNKLWIQASAPANEPHVLEVSANMHLWINKASDVGEAYSLALEDTESARFYRLAPTPPEPPPIRVVMLGDSMVADCCGWGQGIYQYFNANALPLNYAQAWTSSKVFLQSAEYEKMLLIKPNYVLIQYAYSELGADPDRATTPEEFAANLRTIIHAVQDFGGVPVLITLHANRVWDESGKLIYSDHPYNAIIKQLSAELHTPLIDLYELTFDLFTKLGKEGCKFMTYDPSHPEDSMHVSQLGAAWVSRLVAQSLPDKLGPYLVGVLDPPPTP
jgi:lysophospholipase L1-like esterase